MAIVHIASSKEDAEENKDAVNIRRCKGYGDNADDLWLYDTHVGLCVAEREMNGYDDSDFYMTVYESDTDSFKEICFASTRGWTYPCLASKVDASPEIAEKYKQHLQKLAEYRQQLREEAIAKDPTKGKTVKVIKGRKHKDKIGLIFWRGANKFRTYYRNGYNNPNSLFNQRVGIKDDKTGEKFFVPADYVEVVLN